MCPWVHRRPQRRKPQRVGRRTLRGLQDGRSHPVTNLGGRVTEKCTAKIPFLGRTAMHLGGVGCVFHATAIQLNGNHAQAPHRAEQATPACRATSRRPTDREDGDGSDRPRSIDHSQQGQRRHLPGPDQAVCALCALAQRSNPTVDSSTRHIGAVTGRTTPCKPCTPLRRAWARLCVFALSLTHLAAQALPH